MTTFSEQDLTAAEVLVGALDSRLRVLLILELSKRERFVHELVHALGKSQPLISQHLRVLKRSGIVDSERRGREVIYRIVSPATLEVLRSLAEIGAENLTQREKALSSGGAGGIDVLGVAALAPDTP